MASKTLTELLAWDAENSNESRIPSIITLRYLSLQSPWHHRGGLRAEVHDADGQLGIAYAASGGRTSRGSREGLLAIPLESGERVRVMGDVGGTAEVWTHGHTPVATLEAVAFAKYFWWQYPIAWELRTQACTWLIQRQRTSNQYALIGNANHAGRLRVSSSPLQFGQHPDVELEGINDAAELIAMKLCSWWFQMVVNPPDLHCS